MTKIKNNSYPYLRYLRNAATATATTSAMRTSPPAVPPPITAHGVRLIGPGTGVVPGPAGLNKAQAFVCEKKGEGK